MSTRTLLPKNRAYKDFHIRIISKLCRELYVQLRKSKVVNDYKGYLAAFTLKISETPAMPKGNKNIIRRALVNRIPIKIKAISKISNLRLHINDFRNFLCSSDGLKGFMARKIRRTDNVMIIRTNIIPVMLLMLRRVKNA